MADLKELLGDKYKEGMTIEDIMSLEVEEPKADTSAYDNLKKRFDEVASEAANYKKQRSLYSLKEYFTNRFSAKTYIYLFPFILYPISILVLPVFSNVHSFKVSKKSFLITL